VKVINLNEGAQREFVNNPNRASSYIGGLGSGKTFAGIARGLLFSQQPMAPGSFFGPRGCIAAINYPVLEDVVLPQFFEMMDGAGLWKTGEQSGSWVASKKRARLVANCGCPNRRTCKHESSILFRSLDRPNWMRGLELCWFFIDEGRHITEAAWSVLWSRLRQREYENRAGWVCSTPNGFDWMWRVFHEGSPKKLEGAQWYGAPTMENRHHLPEDYIESLFAQFDGAELRQEVYGEFVGITEGAVFYAFAPDRAATEVPYRPDLDLYSAWDFGMGDDTVVLFVQLEYVEKYIEETGSTVYVPKARVVGSLAAANRTSGLWVHEFNRYCDNHFAGRRPLMNIGDPAGRQRNQVTGTSVVEDMAAHGLVITCAPKQPQDKSINLLNNMMEGDRVLVDRVRASSVVAALSSHKWPMDPDGNRKGTTPVHDWTSHYADALRYWALVVIGAFKNRIDKKPAVPPGPGTMGYLTNQLLTQDPGTWLGPGRGEPTIDWQPGIIRPQPDGRLVASPE
jgi:hypothetical protein